MKKYIIGTAIGMVVGIMIQSNWDAKKKASDEAAKAWDWLKKKYQESKKDLKENLEEVKEEIQEEVQEDDK